MQLDNEILKNGDAVYHLIHGSGTVVATYPNHADVLFGKMRLVCSEATITQSGIKMFGLQAPLTYWRTTRKERPLAAYLPIIESLEALQ